MADGDGQTEIAKEVLIHEAVFTENNFDFKLNFTISKEEQSLLLSLLSMSKMLLLTQIILFQVKTLPLKLKLLI